MQSLSGMPGLQTDTGAEPFGERDAVRLAARDIGDLERMGEAGAGAVDGLLLPPVAQRGEIRLLARAAIVFGGVQQVVP